MAKAMDEGRTKTMKQFMEERGLATPLVSVLLDTQDVLRAREQARSRGMNAGAYICGLLHGAVMKSDAA